MAHPGSQFGDTTLTKVFVGGLPWETQSEALRLHFHRFGEILEAVVIFDKTTGRSKGYGFVTFSDPEAAKRACEDPSPVVGGRRANCNLASVGRLRPAVAYGQSSADHPVIRSMPVPQVAFVGSSTYQQPVSYNYQQASPYPSYGYMPFGPGYAHPQNPYGLYTWQQYFQVYGIPGSVYPATYPSSQLDQPLPTGHDHTIAQSYGIQGPHLTEVSGPYVSGVTSAPLPASQPSYPRGSATPLPAHPHFIVPAISPRFIGSNRTTDWRSA